MQVNAWLLDANQYVSDEDNATFSCRVSGKWMLQLLYIHTFKYNCIYLFLEYA